MLIKLIVERDLVEYGGGIPPRFQDVERILGV
jgi:hypothetical protein